MDLKRLKQTLDKINEFGCSDNGINRLAYTDVEQQALTYLMTLCEKEGMTVKVDAAGNLIARREGKNPTLPVVAFGSHIDSVYQAGKYDGTVGVITALEVIRSLNDRGIVTEHPIELISFACEESARFSFSTLGSKAMSGQLELEEIANLKDKDGIYLRDELSKYSINIGGIKQAQRSKEEFKVFLELHVEQGPMLERENKQIGIITGIAAPTRFKLEVMGQAMHSGTTPMGYRKDALLGASEIGLALELAATSEAVSGTVGTVGVCNVVEGAMNVVPGLVEMKVDIRGTSAESKKAVIERLKKAICEIEEKRNLKIVMTQTSDESPIVLNSEVIRSLKETCEENGIDYMLMPSGAGHDAMNISKLCPTGMLFIPSKGGLSHNPDEYSSLEQIGIGATLLEKEILKWAVVDYADQQINCLVK